MMNLNNNSSIYQQEKFWLVPWLKFSVLIWSVEKSYRKSENRKYSISNRTIEKDNEEDCHCENRQINIILATDGYFLDTTCIQPYFHDVLVGSQDKNSNKTKIIWGTVFYFIVYYFLFYRQKTCSVQSKIFFHNIHYFHPI